MQMPLMITHFGPNLSESQPAIGNITPVCNVRTPLTTDAAARLKPRSEAIGLQSQLGLFTRPERVIVLALGLLLNQIPYALVIALGIMAVFSFVTIGQRLIYVWQQTKVK